jgi:hypothetical protein
MKIQITDHVKISSIQEEFNRMFPYLKLEFFSKPHKSGGTSPRKLMKSNINTIGECRTNNKSGEIFVSPLITVSELEQQFSELYGLNVQVFRKSGNVWLETTVTDRWTLEEQNSQGEALTNTRRMV